MLCEQLPTVIGRTGCIIWFDGILKKTAVYPWTYRSAELSSVWKCTIVQGLEPDDSPLKILEDLLTTQIKPSLLSRAWKALSSPLRPPCCPCIWLLTPKYVPAHWPITTSQNPWLFKKSVLPPSLHMQFLFLFQSLVLPRWPATSRIALHFPFWLIGCC